MRATRTFWCLLLVFGAVLFGLSRLARTQNANPWDTPQGQACFERWISEAMGKLNAYNGRDEFNGRKPWSINKYGILEGNPRTGPRSVYAPDNFRDYNNNKYWYMWDYWVTDANGYWRDPEWNGAGVPALRSYVTSCVGGQGGGGSTNNPGGPTTGDPGNGQQGSFPGMPPSFGCRSQGTVIYADDNDTDNQLGGCENQVPFGSEEGDKTRCFTFRYNVPAGGVTSAFMRLNVKIVNGLSDTDNVVVATATPSPDCGQAGKMAGCAVVRGGFGGNATEADIDLLNKGCDSNIIIGEKFLPAVQAQLNTGVLHVLMQDDTAIYGAQLVLNCDPSCNGGNGNGGGGGGTGSNGGGSWGGNEPDPNVQGMTLQAGRRRVLAGELTTIPVWLIKGANLANLNFEVAYNSSVARPEGGIQKGNLLGNTLFSSNAGESNLVRIGFAQTSGLSGTGTVAYIPFRAAGRPGDRTSLDLNVSTINDPSGNGLAIARIPGEIMIVGPDGLIPGDCNGDGVIEARDAECALDMSVRLRAVSMSLDIDKNGEVTSRDATVILQQVISR